MEGNLETKRENCNQCTFDAENIESLENHLIDVHGHQCVICDGKEKTKENKKKHIEDKHSFSCDCENKSITEDNARKYQEKNHSYFQ